MSPKRFSYDDVAKITGEDLEDLRDEEHPGREEPDTEGTGVDEPDLDSAAWDDEIEEKDRDDLRAAGINIGELQEEDRGIYLEMTALRKELNEGTAGREIKSRLNSLIERCEELRRELTRGSRAVFFDVVIGKLKELE